MLFRTIENVYKNFQASIFIRCRTEWSLLQFKKLTRNLPSIILVYISNVTILNKLQIIIYIIVLNKK